MGTKRPLSCNACQSAMETWFTLTFGVCEVWQWHEIGVRLQCEICQRLLWQLLVADTRKVWCPHASGHHQPPIIYCTCVYAGALMCVCLCVCVRKCVCACVCLWACKAVYVHNLQPTSAEQQFNACEVQQFDTAYCAGVLSVAS